MIDGHLAERRMEIVRIATLLSSYLDNLPAEVQPDIRAQVASMIQQPQVAVTVAAAA